MCERTRGGLRRGEQGRGGHAHVTARRWLHRGRGGSCWVQEGSQTGTTESRTADGDGATAAVHHSLRCVEVQRTALQCMAHGAEALCCRTACVLHGCLACVAAWLVPCALWRGVGMGALVPAGSLTCDMRLRFACTWRWHHRFVPSFEKWITFLISLSSPGCEWTRSYTVQRQL